MSAPTEAVELNGISVTQLADTIGAIQGEPSIAQFRFRASTSWQGGGRSQTQIRGFYGANEEDTSRTETFTLNGDEPAVLLGSNTAPNAVEAVDHGAQPRLRHRG